MKKIIFILSLLSSILGYSQSIDTAMMTNNTSNFGLPKYPNGYFKKNFIIPQNGRWGADTLSKIPGSVSVIGLFLYQCNSNGNWKKIYNASDVDEAITASTPTLQEVTDKGNVTDRGISIADTLNLINQSNGQFALKVSTYLNNTQFNWTGANRRLWLNNSSNSNLGVLYGPKGWVGISKLIGSPNPSQALDVSGRIKVDTLIDGSASDSVVVWNRTTKTLNKIAPGFSEASTTTVTTATYTVATTDRLIKINYGAATSTITLPDASTMPYVTLRIKNITSLGVSIANLFASDANLMSGYAGWEIVNDGTTWYVMR